MANDWPDSINNDLVVRGLKSYHNDNDLTLTDCQISLVGKKGDNYSSIMCRAKCQFVTKGNAMKMNIIVKGLPTAEVALKYALESHYFVKEEKMLKDVIPKLEKILQNIGFTEPFAPKFIYSESEPYFVIMMEDLSVEKFENRNRAVGLSFEEGSKVLKLIAAFHAANLAYLNEFPEVKKCFPYTAWGRDNRKNLDPGVLNSIDTIIKSVDKWSDKKWSAKIDNLKNHLLDAFYDQIEFRNPEFPLVLNHGDLWLNNIMFTETDIKFVDFQLSWINSPMFDIIYFIFTSLQTNVRFKHMDDLLKVYHSNLDKFCKELKVDVNYSYDDLKRDFNGKMEFAFVMFSFAFPILTAPPSQAIDLEKVYDDFVDNPIFSNNFFKENFLLGLDFFEENGLFDKSK